MYERFTNRLRTVLRLSDSEAERLRHEYIGTEHYLLGLLREGNGVAIYVLKNLDVDLQAVQSELKKLVVNGPVTSFRGNRLQSPAAKLVIKNALAEALRFDHSYVGTEHLLLGLLGARDGVAARVLMHLGLTLEGVRAETRALLGIGNKQDDAAPPSLTWWRKFAKLFGAR